MAKSKKKAGKKSTAKTTSKKTTKSSKPRKKFKDTTHTCTIADTLEAPSDVESLKEEMEEWRDNMENGNLGYTSKFEDVSSCADELESLHSDLDSVVTELEEAIKEAERPELLKREITYVDRQPYGRGAARWLRLENAIAPLRAAIEVLSREVPESEKDLHEKIREVDSTLDQASSVSFPGMY